MPVTPDTDVDVDELFSEDHLAYNCQQCNKSMELDKCYPEIARKNPTPTTKFYCKNCFNKNNAILDEIDLTNSEQLPPKSKRAKTTKTKTTKAKVIKAKTTKPKYKVSDYVLAQYPGFGEVWFKAEIYAKYKGKYHLYFLEDGSHLKNVEEDALKEADTTEAWTKRKRNDFLNIPFDREGEKWHAVEIGKRHRVNKYGIKPVGKKTDKLLWLGVSNIQNLIQSSS